MSRQTSSLSKQSFFSISSYVLALAFLTYEMALQVSPSVMTSQLMKSLHVDAAGLGVIAAAYFYAYTLFQIPAGLIFDRLSTRTIIAAATFLCALGTVIFGFPDNIWLTSAGRFLMGMGSSFAFIGVLIVSARWFDSKHFSLLVGIAQLLAAFGAMGGEAPLALAVAKYGWQSTVYVLALSGGVLAILILAFVRNRPNKAYQDLHNIPDLKASEKKPILETLKIILSRAQSWWIALYAFVGWAPITIFAALWGIPYLREAYHLSDAHAASYLALIWLGLAIASPIIGWAAGRFKLRKRLMVFTALLGFVSSALVIGIPTLPLWALSIALFAFGVATSGQILAFDAARSINTPETTATAIGFTNMANVAGGALFQPIVGFLLTSISAPIQITDGISHYSVESYQLAMLVVPTAFLVGYISSQWLIKDQQ